MVGAAAQTPPYNLILADAENELAVRALAGAVGDPPGVVGNVPWVEIFAGEFPSVERTMAQGVFSLTEVIPPEPCPGHSRLATVDDVDLLVSWTVDFQQEAVGEIDLERMSRGVSRRIQGPPSRAAMWIHEVEGVPVSMSGNTGPTPNGIRIGPVYTPPEHRGRGYASNLVGYQSGWLLDHGYTFCFLYTDLANPTSNAIYQRLGYGQVAESAEFRFRQGSG